MNVLNLLPTTFMLCLQVFYCSGFSTNYNNSIYQINVFPSKTFAKLDHFWESTGLCPPLPHSDPTFLLSDDIKQNLLLVSSVPHRGIKQVRIHWLLDLIKREKNSYDFSKLDKLVDFFFKNDIYLGFELMGSPSQYFTNFDNMDQVLKFKELVKSVANRYVNLYGIEYVSKWNFETWNEPDHLDFDNVTITVPGFLKYYDACSVGLLEVDAKLRFGGPGGSCKNYSKRCWALLNHVVNGKNYITGKKGSRMDYISIHKKGSGFAKNILSTELKTVDTIFSNFPELKSKDIYNDEADPLVGWSKPQWWRSDVTYAALVVKVIAEHQYGILANDSRKGIRYKLLSNDNAFLNFAPYYFTQRTLNARFQINNTNPKYVHFVRKPILAVMGLLSKLGDIQIVSTSIENSITIGHIASRNSESKALELAVLIYNSADSQPVANISEVLVTVNELTTMGVAQNLRSVTCNLNNYVTNPYALWKKMGSPVFPNPEQLAKLHSVEEPQCSDPVLVKAETLKSYKVHLQLPLPGVALHMLCEKPKTQLQSPISVQVYNITFNQVLISWKDKQIDTKCIQTYVVEFSPTNKAKSFKSINPYKIIFNSFIYIVDNALGNMTLGWYRVKVIDFWDRHSPYSNKVYFK